MRKYNFFKTVYSRACKKRVFDLAVVPVVSVIKDGYDGMRYVVAKNVKKCRP